MSDLFLIQTTIRYDAIRYVKKAEVEMNVSHMINAVLLPCNTDEAKSGQINSIQVTHRYTHHTPHTALISTVHQCSSASHIPERKVKPATKRNNVIPYHSIPISTPLYSTAAHTFDGAGGERL